MRNAKCELWILALAVLVAVVMAPGCANVELRGPAMTAAENSTVNAYAAWYRADPNATDGLLVMYLRHNADDWRSYVRAAKRDPNWGGGLNTRP